MSFDSLLQRIPGSVIIEFSRFTKVDQEKDLISIFFILTLYLTTIIQYSNYSNYNRIHINIGFHMTYNVMIKNAKFNIFPSAVLAVLHFRNSASLEGSMQCIQIYLCKNVAFGHFSIRTSQRRSARAPQ